MKGLNTADLVRTDYLNGVYAAVSDLKFHFVQDYADSIKVPIVEGEVGAIYGKGSDGEDIVVARIVSLSQKAMAERSRT